jgi:enoyl-CoA hydratase/carnithine racemase
MSERPAYFDKYKTLKFERSDDGVLVVTWHSDGGPVLYGSQHHSEWAPAFTDIGMDRANRVVVFTGTGDVFIDKHGHWDAPLRTPLEFDVPSWGEKTMFSRMFEIEAPIICACNGPATIHGELMVLGDINLASTTACYADEGHFTAGEVPGDGVHIIWQELLGANRGKYFLMTGQRIDAWEAQRLGVVGEVLEPQDLMPRAMELAHQLATYSDLTLRYTRTCFVDRWKKLFTDSAGVGYGMALQALSHLDRGWMVWNHSNEDNPDFKQLQTISAKPSAKQPR